MKISFVIPTLEIGGAELLLKDVTNELFSKGIEVQIIVLSDRTKLLPEFNKSIQIVVLGESKLASFGRKSVFKAFCVRNKMRKILTNFQPDCIIANLPLSHFVCRISFLNTSIKSKLWIHHHSLQYIANPVTTYTQQLLHYVSKKWSKKVDYGHLYISDAVQENIAKEFPTNVGYVIRNAIKDNFDTISKTTYPHVFENFFNIVIPGRLVKEKGHIKFLESIYSLISENKNIKVWIIGIGPQEENIKKYISTTELNENVKFLGLLANAELHRFMFHCNLIIVPSIIEGLGIVAIEAIMLNKSIIVSNAGGLPEIIKNNENGFVFNIEHYEQLNDIILSIYNNQNFTEKLIIRDSFLEFYTIEKYTEKLLNILQN